MKGLLLVALATFSILSSLQAQTTQEEYNYVTKGWKNHLEDGSDVKQGYSMKYVKEVKVTSADGQRRKATLWEFIKRKEIGVDITVAFMIIYQKNEDASDYICVPHPKSDATIQAAYAQMLYDGKVDSSYKLQVITVLLSTNLKWTL